MTELFRRIGVLGAMPSEIEALAGAMNVRKHNRATSFEVWEGGLFGHDCVVARCGMGKVAAASSLQRLIDRWQIDCALVCGLAGALGSDLRFGDVVIGESFLQYDLDASPIYPRYEVPDLGIGRFSASPHLVSRAHDAAAAFLERGLKEAAGKETLSHFGIDAPRVVSGLIVTGDQFVKDDVREALRRDLPEARCVEMEGGAIAQVCHLNGVAFVIVRVISDNADAAAPRDFLRFVREIAPVYTLGIVRELLSRLA